MYSFWTKKIHRRTAHDGKLLTSKRVHIETVWNGIVPWDQSGAQLPCKVTWQIRNQVWGNFSFSFFFYFYFFLYFLYFFSRESVGQKSKGQIVNTFLVTFVTSHRDNYTLALTPNAFKGSWQSVVVPSIQCQLRPHHHVARQEVYSTYEITNGLGKHLQAHLLG